MGISARALSGQACSTSHPAPQARTCHHHILPHRSHQRPCKRWHSVVTKAQIGPQPPSAPRQRKPEWVRLLEDDADVDDDVAKLLEGTGGDPDKIRSKMRNVLENKQLYEERGGVEEPPAVKFHDLDAFDCWLWLEMYRPPTARERELLESCLRSWFVVGKLGGYNSQNLQVSYGASEDQSYFTYDNEAAEEAMGSFVHSIAEPEYNGAWARLNIDLGTCDELALDVLINMLCGFSREHVGLRRINIGGEVAGWELPRAPQEGPLKVSIDPMKLPEGVGEELELLDELLEDEEEEVAGRLAGLQGEPGDLDELQERSGLDMDSRGMRLYSEEGFKKQFPSRRG